LLVKGCGVNLSHLVSWIAAIPILYFLSSLIVIRRLPGLYTCTVIIHYKWPIVSPFSVTVGLHRDDQSHFFFFFFRNKGFFRGRRISTSHNSLTPEGHVLVVTLQAPSHTVAISRPTVIRRYV
jgi:hypothetical protein